MVEDRREDREAKLRERAENACQRDHIDGQKPQCSNCLAILAALRQTEEEAYQRGLRAVDCITGVAHLHKLGMVCEEARAAGEQAGRDAERARIFSALLARGTFLAFDAPCLFCGYSGEGYYQPEQHKCAAIRSRGSE